ncbi:MAG: hypothetical protein ABR915_15065, partial [Thermoguttaceae bacterium]
MNDPAKEAKEAGHMIENVLGSLIAAGIGAGSLHLWSKVVVPWYQSITYQGPDLAGTWGFSYSDNGASDDHVVEVRQYGKNLKGVHTVHRWKDGTSASITVPFSGQVFGHVVLLTGIDFTTGTLGAQLLDILDGAKRLRGYLLA